MQVQADRALVVPRDFVVVSRDLDILMQIDRAMNKEKKQLTRFLHLMSTNIQMQIDCKGKENKTHLFVL